MLNKLQPENTEKKRVQIKEQVLFNIAYILDNFPQYTIAQHFTLLLRRRNSVGKEVYFWTDEEILSKLEKYVDELNSELAEAKEIE